jgi:hypothetical protein
MPEYIAGSAAVPVTPDLSGFQEEVKAKLAEVPDFALKVTADTAEARAQIDGLGTDSKATVTADADTAPAEAKLTALTKKPWTVKVKAVADKVSGKTGTLADLLNPVGIGAAAGVALGPSALGLGAGLAGIGAGFAAAAADAGAFGVIAKGMFTDVGDAQKKLTAAQAAYSKATTGAGQAAALKAEKAALDGLTPAERQLATELSALAAAWKQLQKAEQPAVGAAIAPWLKTATSGMSLLKPLVTDGAQAVELLGNEADHALQSPFWQKFSDTFGATGEEAIQVFGTAAGQVGDGLAHLFVAFAPDIDNLLPSVDKLSGAFDKWASSVTDQGLKDFLTKTFSPANVHALATDGKELASFVEQVAKASQDMSPLAFTGLGNVMTILGSLTPTEIEALTGLFLAIKTVGTISKGVSAVSGVVGTVKGLLGGAATTAETEAEGTAAGAAAGTSAATAFTSTFAAEVTAALPAVFTELGATGGAEAATAGAAWGTAAAAAFSTALGAEDAIELTGVLTGLGVEGDAEAALAGASMGTAFAGGFGESLAGIGAAVAAALPEAGGLALLGAGIAGAALGLAVGTGFNVGFGASGAKDAASGLMNDVKSSTAGASAWLQPAGQQAGQGFVTGFDSEAAAIKASVGQVKTWTQAAAAGSGTWIQPHGQQAGQGFATGFAGEHAAINSGAAQLKGWVTSAIPAPGSWLVNEGISVVQGFLNGLVSEAGSVYAEADNIANTVKAKIQSALGINSPAKVMIPLGSAVPEGLALGMDNGTSFVTDAGGRLAGATAASLAGLAATQSLSAMSALGIPSLAAVATLPGVGSPATGGAQLNLNVTGSPGGTLDRLFLDWLQEMNSRGQLTLTTG